MPSPGSRFNIWPWEVVDPTADSCSRILDLAFCALLQCLLSFQAHFASLYQQDLFFMIIDRQFSRWCFAVLSHSSEPLRIYPVWHCPMLIRALYNTYIYIYIVAWANICISTGTRALCHSFLWWIAASESYPPTTAVHGCYWGLKALSRSEAGHLWPTIFGRQDSSMAYRWVTSRLQANNTRHRHDFALRIYNWNCLSHHRNELQALALRFL